jgi:hypothetical protein
LTNREALDKDVVLRILILDEEVREELSTGEIAEQETGSDGEVGLSDRIPSEYDSS